VVLAYGAGPDPMVAAATRRSVKIAAPDEVGISFLGAGNFARGVLLPAVKRSLKTSLVGVSAATGVSARNTADQFGFAYATGDLEELFGDPNAHCIFIATRHNLHAGLAAEALRRGKAVFVEKPLALTEQDLSQVVAAAEATGGLLMVGYNRRFAPVAQDVKAYFSGRSGPMTILYRINAGQLAAGHWAMDGVEGGGRVIGEVCHFVDFVQFLTNSLPARVCSASVGQSRKAGFVDDSVAVSIKMADGSIASILYAASGDPSAPKEKIEVFCDRRIAVIDDFKTAELLTDGKKVIAGSRNQDKGHRAEVAAFLDAVRRGGEAPIALASLAATSSACFAINECARSGAPTDVVGPVP